MTFVVRVHPNLSDVKVTEVSNYNKVKYMKCHENNYMWIQRELWGFRDQLHKWRTGTLLKFLESPFQTPESSWWHLLWLFHLLSSSSKAGHAMLRGITAVLVRRREELFLLCHHPEGIWRINLAILSSLDRTENGLDRGMKSNQHQNRGAQPRTKQSW